ncbi:unnamed protein product [Rangifer tarandus platyrhynchus]|uniref:Uncharacterized protein n=1 Tax=Rangifer tarandus platyrhynchus TaxID=3082113 RepID=A0ABN8Z2G3_RANTA|nr:unnamed protein product [Rangifer tarandus platyrhynchus]
MVPQRRGNFPLKTAPRLARRRHGVNPPGAKLAPPPRAPPRPHRRAHTGLPREALLTADPAAPRSEGSGMSGGEVKFRPRSGAGEDPRLPFPMGKGTRAPPPRAVAPPSLRCSGGLTAEDAPGLAGRLSQPGYWVGVGESLGPRCLRMEWARSEGRAMPGSWSLFLIYGVWRKGAASDLGITSVPVG